MASAQLPLQQGEQIIGLAVLSWQAIVQDLQPLPANGAAHLGDRLALANQQAHGLAIKRIVRFQLTNGETWRGDRGGHGTPAGRPH